MELGAGKGSSYPGAAIYLTSCRLPRSGRRGLAVVRSRPEALLREALLCPALLSPEHRPGSDGAQAAARRWV